MDQEPLVNEKIEAGAAFLKAFGKYAKVKAACWIKEADASKWHLYVASDDITDAKVREGYGQVIQILRKKPSLYLNSFDIKLVSGDHPLVSDISELYKRYPAPIPTRYGGSYFGGMSVDGVLIYPPAKVRKKKTKAKSLNR